MDAILKLIGLPSPAVLLGVLVALAAVAGWSYHAGDSAGFNRAESARAQSQDRAIAALGEQLTATRQEAMAQAAARGEATAAADRAKAGLASALKELRDEKNRPRPDCVPESYRVRLNAAIGAANQSLPAVRDTGILPITLPAHPAPRIGFGPVDGGSGGGVGGMPKNP